MFELALAPYVAEAGGLELRLSDSTEGVLGLLACTVTPSSAGFSYLTIRLYLGWKDSVINRNLTTDFCDTGHFLPFLPCPQ